MVRMFATTGFIKLGKSMNEYYVEQDGKEFQLGLKDVILWNSLSFRLLDYDTLKMQYLEKRKEYHDFSDDTMDEILDRFIVRGLIAEGNGMSQVDALYDLLKNLRLVNIKVSFYQRILTFLHMAFHTDLPFRQLKSVLKSVPLTALEKAILSSCGSLNVGEMVQMMENNKGADANIRRLLLCISPAGKEVLTAVTNLYLNRLVYLTK